MEERLTVTTPDGTKVTNEEDDEQDITLEMNTGDGVSIFTTELIEGCFEALILTTDKKVHVRIDSENGYNIFEMKEYPANVGDPNTTYIPIRTQAWDETGYQSNFQSTPFYLNERLIFTVDGQANTNVKFLLRMQ